MWECEAKHTYEDLSAQFGLIEKKLGTRKFSELRFSEPESTDESDLEAAEDEPRTKPKPKIKNRPIKSFEISSSSSTIQIRSKAQGIKIKTGGNF